MIGTLISVGAGLLGSVISSKAANEQAEKTQLQLDRQRAENAAWYNRRYYEDGTQRADVQRALTKGAENLRRQNQAVSGSNSVMGGTNASAAAAKEANNQAYADMVSQAAATADARKDAIDESYRSRSASLDQQQMQVDQDRTNAKINAINSSVQAVGTAAAGLEKASGERIAANTKSTSGNDGTSQNKGGSWTTRMKRYYANKWKDL